MGTIDWDFITIFLFALSAGLFVIGEKNRKIFCNDFKMPFTAEGRATIRKENYGKHFVRSGYLAVPVAAIAFFLPQVKDWSWYHAVIPALLLGVAGNAVWERIRQKKAGKERDGMWKVPFSITDCRYGAYGFTLVFIAILELLKHLF